MGSIFDNGPIEGQVMPREAFKKFQQGGDVTASQDQVQGQGQRTAEREKVTPIAAPRDAMGRIIIGGGDDGPDPNGQMS